MDYVVAAQSQSGKVDLMQFMKEFAHKNALAMDLPKALPYGL